MSNIKFILVFISLNFGMQSGSAQGEHKDISHTSEIDHSIRYGRLPNGLTYFLKSVPSQPRTLMELMHKAGSSQDDPDQFNVAHAIEHLAYKSSKNFPEGIVNSPSMASSDMTIYDYAAGSGERSTDYKFLVPPGDTTALNVGILWFKDILSGLHLTNPDINSVRGEILQEYLLRSGEKLNEKSANSRLKELIFPCSTDYTHYIEYLANFKPEVLRRFYKDWYRPDLAAISIVGRIDDLDEMEERIKKSFSEIPPPVDPRKLRICDEEYYNRAPQFHIVERPIDTTKVIQNNDVSVKLIYRDPLTGENRHRLEGLERMMIMEMITAAVDKRLEEVTNDYNSFDLNSIYPYRLRKKTPIMEVVMNLEKVQVKTGIEKTIGVLNQLKEYGVTNDEWEELKREQVEYLDHEEEEDADYWLDEIHDYFLYGEALPDNKQFHLKNWLSELESTEFNNVLQHFLSKNPEDIGIIAPAGDDVLSYREKEVRSWIDNAYRKETEPYRSPEVPETIMSAQEVEALRQEGYISKSIGPSGSQEFVLQNGLKIVLNKVIPSKNSKGKIYLHGFSLNGANSFSQEDYFSAINSPGIVRNAGVKGLDKFQIDRFLAKTSLPRGINLYASDFESGVKSEAQVEDLEIMLQLIFLYFTQPNKSRIAFEDWEAKAYRAYQNPSIDNDFNIAIRTFLGESGERDFFETSSLGGTKRFEGIGKTDFQRANRIFKKLFGNPEDFTFIVTGDFEVVEILPLIEKYLGNLPERSYIFSKADKNENFSIPSGPTLVELPAPKNYRLKNVMYGITFIEEAHDPNDWKEQIIVEALAGVATQKAWALRFEQGYSIYAVSVWGTYNHHMNRYEIGSVFPTVPKEFINIREEFKKIISEIKSGAISKKEFQDGVRMMYIFHGANRVQRLMHPKIYEHYRFGEPWVDPVDEEEFTRSVTIDDVVKVANKYLKEENLYEFVMKDKD